MVMINTIIEDLTSERPPFGTVEERILTLPQKSSLCSLVIAAAGANWGIESVEHASLMLDRFSPESDPD